MSAKTRRLLPVLIVGCMTSLLLAACGGKESESSATTSPASSRPDAHNPSTARPPVPQGRAAPVGRAQPEHHRQGEEDNRHTAARPSHKKDPSDGSDVDSLVEHMLGPATSGRGGRDGERSRRALDRLLAKAKEEGIKVVGQDGGGGGAEAILQQLGGKNP